MLSRFGIDASGSAVSPSIWPCDAAGEAKTAAATGAALPSTNQEAGTTGTTLKKSFTKQPAIDNRLQSTFSSKQTHAICPSLHSNTVGQWDILRLRFEFANIKEYSINNMRRNHLQGKEIRE
jgi:hypothetical protein